MPRSSSSERSLHLGFERGDLGDDRLERFELPALAGVEELVEEAHTGIECTGGKSGDGPTRSGTAARLRAFRP